MFGIGYPAIVPPVTHRRSLEEIVHHERYEDEKARDTEALERFLWGDTLLGGWRSTGGLKGNAAPSGE
jgi:hypothetical protein